MLQMIRAILGDPVDLTSLSLVFANRHEEDILTRVELDALAAEHPTRLKIHYVLSSPSGTWEGGKGRLTLADLGVLPPPTQRSSMVMVCGRDEFVGHVSGTTVRAPPPPGKKKGPKVQGELVGILKEAGYAESQVYKF